MPGVAVKCDLWFTVRPYGRIGNCRLRFPAADPGDRKVSYSIDYLPQIIYGPYITGVRAGSTGSGILTLHQYTLDVGDTHYTARPTSHISVITRGVANSLLMPRGRHTARRPRASMSNPLALFWPLSGPYLSGPGLHALKPRLESSPA